MSRSNSLDETIDAKEKKINQLEAKANEKLQDLYTVKQHGDWQDPIFFGMSAYIYRFDEGLQFCIKPKSVVRTIWKQMGVNANAVSNGRH